MRLGCETCTSGRGVDACVQFGRWSMVRRLRGSVVRGTECHGDEVMRRSRGH